VKNPDQLPVSHTCSKELEMPEYSSKNILRDKLLIAIEEGNQGFYIG
jgi:E3 ubiquitin-protein ligase HUWE1